MNILLWIMKKEILSHPCHLTDCFWFMCPTCNTRYSCRNPASLQQGVVFVSFQYLASPMPSTHPSHALPHPSRALPTPVPCPPHSCLRVLPTPTPVPSHTCPRALPTSVSLGVLPLCQSRENISGVPLGIRTKFCFGIFSCVNLLSPEL